MTTNFSLQNPVEGGGSLQPSQHGETLGATTSSYENVSNQSAKLYVLAHSYSCPLANANSERNYFVAKNALSCV